MKSHLKTNPESTISYLSTYFAKFKTPTLNYKFISKFPNPKKKLNSDIFLGAIGLNKGQESFFTIMGE